MSIYNYVIWEIIAYYMNSYFKFLSRIHITLFTINKNKLNIK